MIPAKFKKLEYIKDDYYCYVGLSWGVYMLWVGPEHAKKYPQYYDKEGFHLYNTGIDTEEMNFYNNNEEYRNYIKNFIIKSLL